MALLSASLDAITFRMGVNGMSVYPAGLSVDGAGATGAAAAWTAGTGVALDEWPDFAARF